MANNTQDISLRTEDDIFGQDIIGISKSKTMLAGGKGPGREAGSKITFKEPKGKSNHGRHGSKMRSNKNKGKSKDQGITIPILAPSQASPERAKYLIKVQSKLAEDSSLDPTIDQEGSDHYMEQYVINWSETPLYKYYLQNQAIIDIQKFHQIGHDPQSGYLAWNQRHYTNWEVEQLLGMIKANYNSYKNQKVHGPLYVKSLLTLKYLFEEQGIDYSKLLKVRQIYGDISIENTLKLLIRCKILFATRMSLIDLFDTINRFKTQEQELIEYSKEEEQELQQEKENEPEDDKEEDATQPQNPSLSNALNLNAQYVAIAEELIAKIKILTSGQHKSLKNQPFYFGGDHVTEEFVKQRVTVVQNTLEKKWIGESKDDGGQPQSSSCTFKLPLRDSEEVYNEVMSHKFKQIEQVKLEEKMQQMSVPLPADGQNQQQLQNQSDHFNQSELTPTVGNLTDLHSMSIQENQEQRKTEKDLLAFSKGDEARGLDSILKDPNSRTEAAASYGTPSSFTGFKQNSLNSDATPTNRKFGSITFKDQKSKMQPELQMISEDQDHTQDSPISPQQVLNQDSARGHQASKEFGEMIIYQSQPKSKINLRAKYGKAKRSRSPLNLIPGTEGFLPLFKEGQSLQEKAQPVMYLAPNRIRDGSRKRKRHSPGKRVFEAYPPEKVDELKSMALRQRSNFVRKGATPKQLVRLPKPSANAGGYQTIQAPSVPMQSAAPNANLLTRFQHRRHTTNVEINPMKGPISIAPGMANQQTMILPPANAVSGAPLMQQDNKVDDATDLAPEQDIQSDLKAKIREQKGRKKRGDGHAGDAPADAPVVQDNQDENKVLPQVRAATTGKQIRKIAVRPYNQTVMESFFKNQRTMHPTIQEDSKRASDDQFDYMARPQKRFVSPFRDVKIGAARVPGGSHVKTAWQSTRRGLGAVKPSNITINEKSGAGPFEKNDDGATQPTNLSTSLVVGNLRSHRQSRNTVTQPGGDLSKMKKRGFLTGAISTPRGQDDKSVNNSNLQQINNRINNVEQKLENLGVILPTPSTDQQIGPKEESKTGTSTKFAKANSFLPPYGGHTQNSFIRQEMQQWQNLNQQLSADHVAPKESDRTTRTAQQKPTQDASRFISTTAETPMVQETVIGEHKIETTNSSETFARAMGGTAATRLNPLNHAKTHSLAASLKKGALSAAEGQKLLNQSQEGNADGLQSHIPWTISEENRRIASTNLREEREARILMHNLERQLKKMEELKEKQVKEQMAKFYLENFGIVVPELTMFVTPIDDLREFFIRKANAVTLHRAATRIQRWYKGLYEKRKAVRDREKYLKAIVLLQKRVRVWKQNIRDPAKLKLQQERATFLIQKFLRGYQARRVVDYWIMDAKADKLYDYWHRIDIVCKSHFQRRIRRAWLEYKRRKEEKAKKKAASKKKKKGKKKSAPRPTTLNPGAEGNVTLGGPEDQADGPEPGEDGEGAPEEGGDENPEGEGEGDGAEKENAEGEGDGDGEGKEGQGENPEEGADKPPEDGEEKPPQDGEDKPPEEGGDKPPEAKPDADNLSDDMARATNQDTVMKLADEATNIKDDTLELGDRTLNGSQGPVVADTIDPNVPNQASICISCKQENNITDLKDVDKILEDSQPKQEAEQVVKEEQNTQNDDKDHEATAQIDQDEPEKEKKEDQQTKIGEEKANESENPNRIGEETAQNQEEKTEVVEQKPDAQEESHKLDDAKDDHQAEQSKVDEERIENQEEQNKVQDDGVEKQEAPENDKEVTNAQNEEKVPQVDTESVPANPAQAPADEMQAKAEEQQETADVLDGAEKAQQEEQAPQTDVEFVKANLEYGIVEEMQTKTEQIVEEKKEWIKVNLEYNLANEMQDKKEEIMEKKEAKEKEQNEKAEEQLVEQPVVTQSNSQEQMQPPQHEENVASKMSKYPTTNELDETAHIQHLQVLTKSEHPNNEEQSMLTVANQFSKQDQEFKIEDQHSKTSIAEGQSIVPKLSLKSDYVNATQNDQSLPNFGNVNTNRTMDVNLHSSSRDRIDKSTIRNDQKQIISEEDRAKVFVNFSAKDCSPNESQASVKSKKEEVSGNQPEVDPSQPRRDDQSITHAQGHSQQVLERDGSELHEQAIARQQIPQSESKVLDTYKEMGILVSPTFNEAGSEEDKKLSENVVLSARKQGLNLTVLESFGHNNSSKAIISNGAADNAQKLENQEIDGDVLIGQDRQDQEEADDKEYDNYNDQEFINYDDQDDEEPQKENKEIVYDEPEDDYEDDNFT